MAIYGHYSVQLWYMQNSVDQINSLKVDGGLSF